MNEQTQPATIRVFIALAPPDPAKEELARKLRPAYGSHPRMRWNRVEDWHITLAFLGELPVDTVPLLRAPLAGIAAAHPSPRLALRGGGDFDGRVVWTGVDGDLDALYELAADVRTAVRDCGAVPADRPLRPHLTLARARRGDQSSAAEIAAGLAGFTGRPWDAERLHLVGSNAARSSGPIHYRDITAWPLGSGDRGEASSAPPPAAVPYGSARPAAGTAHDG
ncbi:RNA 2',3'-cyclic phosphodiesterase [Streptomyces sp. NBC_01220]|uniref:RNA 2',3'-cyclic phosphodiesterase n=1 Tax=unclassified Streptomyces TaxID=2593676 RepID=UPI002E34C535|nr:RNA 2',3'-cyclic phosphodiesterase [Streptomyces sp. NBC_01358]WSQ41645.1 RNA 2',3'-cyclic phosphodiesterase [Streptomyces sp. NBC_01220]